MSFVLDDWFVRQHIVDELNEKVVDIAGYILDNHGPEFFGTDEDVASNVLSESTIRFIDMSDMTRDECHYVLDNVYTYCCIGFAYRHGLLKEDPQGKIHLHKGIENI